MPNTLAALQVSALALFEVQSCHRAPTRLAGEVVSVHRANLVA
jgi:hypothetical protein